MSSVLTEIDSFTTKFKALLSSGYEATLTLEADGGQVFATLKAGLGHNLFPAVKAADSKCKIKRPRSPAYFRRQEKRKLEKMQLIQTEEDDAVVVTLNVDTNENDVLDSPLAEKAQVSEDLIKETEKSLETLKIGDYDTFTFGYWSEKEVSPSEAVKQIRKSLDNTFIDNKIDVEDQRFEICGAVCVDKNEIEVQVRVQKGYVKLKQAVRKIQTRYVPGDSFEISLIRLST